MSTEDSRISIYELKNPDEDRDPRLQRTDEQIQRLKTRFDESGWLSPIVFTSDERLIVDGNTRINALKQFDDEGEYEFLRILGEFQGYTFAVPDTNVDIGPEEAAAELNIYRENLTGADRTTYLNWLIKSQIIDSEECHVARDANTTELLSQLEDGREWEYSEEAKAELEELLSVMDFESPQSARNHISYYNRAPESAQELWILDEINYSHLEELTRISERLEQGADLADTSIRSGHSFEDLIEYSREDDYRDQDEYYTRNELRDIVEELDSVLEQDQKEKNLLDAIGADKEQRDRIQGIADGWGTSAENVVKNNLLDDENADPEDIEEFDDDELNERLEREEEKVDSDPSWFEQATNRSSSDRENIREQALGDFSDTDWKRSYAVPGEYHKAPPLVEENVQVFFHDSANTGDSSNYSGSMDDEISNESVDLFFFSPPYYVQRGTIDTYDSYDDYLDDMRKVFTSVYKKLKPHRYFLLNISDHTTTGGQDNESGKRLPIQSDVSSMISREIGFEYEGTIRWYKPNPTSSQRASHYFENENTKGQPLYYYPEDRIEEIFIFRKGERHQEAVYTEAMERFDDQFNNLETFRETVARDNPKEAFQRAFTEKVDLDKFSGIYKTDLWPIVPTASNEGITTHTAGFPKRLAKLVVQLYSLPGDRIADPMVGFGSTLAAVQDLNQESEFDVHREGLGWESFKGEQEDQPDYYDVIQRMLGTTGIDQFLSPA